MQLRVWGYQEQRYIEKLRNIILNTKFDSRRRILTFPTFCYRNSVNKAKHDTVETICINDMRQNENA